MKLHDVEQNTQAWLELRAGRPTASEFGALITPLGKIRKGEGVETYLAQKLAERWLQGPLPGFGKRPETFAQEQGHLMEERALPWLVFESGLEFHKVGFITTDDGKVGCSPDGWLDVARGGVEIKCPEPTAHCSYLLAGEVPEKYVAQVQGSMFVTGATSWRFLSFRPPFPALILTVERDPAFQAALAEALENFNRRLDFAYNQLLELNGGPPPKREPMVFADEAVSDPRDNDVSIP